MMKLVIVSLFLVVGLFGSEVYSTFEVKALKSANLSFDTSGIVDKVFVDVGSVISKNDKLVSLKNSDYKARLNITKTSYAYAKKDLNRQEKVKNIIDEAKYDKYKFNYLNAKNQLELQQSLFEKTILKAPFDAIVYEKLVESGDVVSGAAIRTIIKIQSKIKRKLVLEFDQKYHKNVKVGDIFNYKVDGDSRGYKGTISKIYPYADIKTRKIKAEVITKGFVVGLFGDGYITNTK